MKVIAFFNFIEVISEEFVTFVINNICWFKWKFIEKSSKKLFLK